jgi:hypothetical protein
MRIIVGILPRPFLVRSGGAAANRRDQGNLVAVAQDEEVVLVLVVDGHDQCVGFVRQIGMTARDFTYEGAHRGLRGKVQRQGALSGSLTVAGEESYGNVQGADASQG